MTPSLETWLWLLEVVAIAPLVGITIAAFGVAIGVAFAPEP